MTDAILDEHNSSWIECWQCAGVGQLPGCFEDCCSGADCDPEDAESCCAPSRCDVCRGKGGRRVPFGCEES